MPHRVTLIPGDGIGPEVAEATVRVLEATGVPIVWQRAELNKDLIEQTGGAIPEPVLASLRRTTVGLKGPVTTPVGVGFRSLNVALRKEFDLFANLRPVRSFPGLKSRYQDVPVDLIIVRENTEDLYSGLENEVVPGVVTSLKVITEKASLRIARYAFQFARKVGRRKITDTFGACGTWSRVACQMASSERRTDASASCRSSVPARTIAYMSTSPSSRNSICTTSRLASSASA